MKKFIELLILPLKYILLAVSYIFPRNSNIWCFGSAFNGNTKYLFLYMVNNQEKKRCIWIGNKATVEKINNWGYEAYQTWSLRGLFYCLTAGAYIYNSYPGNINLYTMGGAKLVNLWHGIALKCIDRQIKTGPMAKCFHAKGVLYDLYYLNFRKHANVVLSTSPIMTENFSEAFDVPKERIVEGIYPRCDLFSKTETQILDFIKKYEPPYAMELVNKIRSYTYTYIYMPTWRDTGDDFIENYGFDFDKVNEVMVSQNRLFIIKMHPDSNLKIEHNLSNVLVIDSKIDLYPLLPFTDCLITDFSSIYFDYILMKGKHVILYLPDFDDYINKNRALKYPYDDVMKGVRAMSFSQLLDILNEETSSYNVQELDDVRKRFWAPQCENMAQLVECFDSLVK